MPNGLALIPQSYYYEFQQRGVNVKDFGAVGDGTHDDTQAIQNAINAAKGAPVIIPLGTYMISASITPTAVTHITGVGTLKKINNFTNGSGVIDERTGAVTSFTWDGPTIDGNEVNQTPYKTYPTTAAYQTGIRLEYAKNVTIKKGYFTNTGDRGLDLRHCDGILIQGNEFYYCGYNIGGTGANTIPGNPTETNAGNAISYDFCSNLQVIGNIFRVWGDTACDGQDGTNVLMDGNIALGSSYYNVATHLEESGFGCTSATHAIVSNNFIQAQRGVGIWTSDKGATDVTVIGNTIKASANFGVSSVGNSASSPNNKILIRDNNIQLINGATSNGGIYIGNYNADVTVRGNTVDLQGSLFTDQGNGIMTDGLSATHNTNIRIEDNFIINCRGLGVWAQYTDGVAINRNYTRGNGLSYTGQSWYGDIYFLTCTDGECSGNNCHGSTSNLVNSIYVNGSTVNVGNNMGNYTNVVAGTSQTYSPNNLSGTTQTTVGAAGSAAALPIPVGYLQVNINGTLYAIPYFNH